MSKVIIRDQQFVTIGTTEQGPPGKSTYDLAVKAGYVGTLEDWLNAQGVADISQFQQSVDTLSGRVGVNETDISTAEGEIDTLQSDVSGIDGRLTTTEGAVAAIDGRLTSAEGAIDTSQQAISNLQSDKFDKGSVVVNADTALEVNKRYLVDGDITLTLPSASNGDIIYLMKQSGTPTINGPILYQNVSDNTLEYDLDVGLSLVFDGTNWRVE